MVRVKVFYRPRQHCKLTFVQTTLLLRKLPRVAEGGVQVQLQVENSKQLMNDLPIHTRCGYSVHEA